MTFVQLQHGNRSYIINDLLCFVQNSSHRYNRDEIDSAITDFYDSDETTTAKTILGKTASTVGLEREISEFVPVRRSGRKAASADSLVVKDILDIWYVLESKKPSIPTFLAQNCYRIAPIGIIVSSDVAVVLQSLASLSIQMTGIVKGNLLSQAISPSSISPSIASPPDQSSTAVPPPATGVVTLKEPLHPSAPTVDEVEEAADLVSSQPIGPEGASVDPAPTPLQEDAAISTFAAIGALLGASSGDGFQLPPHQIKRQNAANRKKGRVVGSSGLDDDLVALPVRDYWDIHIGNMDGEKVDSAEKIKTFMNRRGVTPVDVWLVGKSTKDDQSNERASTRRRIQAKVRVKTADKDNCLNASFWQTGITVHSWNYERKTGSNRS